MQPHAIPLHKPWFGQDEEAALARVFQHGNLAGNGAECHAFEAEVRATLPVPFCVALSSASSALEIAMRALDVDGGEVVLPSFTFPSVGNAIVAAGGRPVFCEVREPDLNLDIEHALALVTSATRAIVLTHYAGHPVWLQEAPVPVVEDAAHAFGSSIHGRACGTLGTVGCVSFHQTKNLVTGEGGALLTNDADIAHFAEVFREKGTNRDDMVRGIVDKYAWVGLGSSMVMPELAAALGRVQLGKLEAITQARETVASCYDEHLQPLEQRELLRRVANLGAGKSCHHIYGVLVAGDQRDAVVERLAGSGIGAASHFVPLHSSPYGQAVADTPSLPVTDRVAASIVRLPIYPGLGDAEIGRVCSALEDALTTR